MNLAVMVLALTLMHASSARADSVLELGRIGYATRVPETWQAQAPSSSFRLAQFLVPGAAGEVNCVFFYFGPGQGGSVSANIERWQSQFTSVDGSPVRAAIERTQAGTLPVTLLELAGNYARGIGMGSSDAPLQDQAMRVAIVETPQGNLIIQLYGPRAAVLALRSGFDGMVHALHRDR